jgi:Hint domain
MAGTISTTLTSAYTLINSPTTILSTGGVVVDVPNVAAITGPIGTAWTLFNAGQISSTGGTNSYGVSLLGGGFISNAAFGTIAASYEGVYIGGGAGTVINYGLITSPDDAVRVYDGVGTISNFGVLAATGTAGEGVELRHGGSVSNAAGATIAATAVAYPGVGIYGGAGTVTNAGTISAGNKAVRLNAGYTNLLLVDPGAVFIGEVDGGNTIGASVASTLELASGAFAGTLSGLGSQFIDFAQTKIDAGASWTFVSSNTIAAGETFIDGGTLTNSGTLVGEVSLVAGATLVNTNSELISNPSATAVYATGTGILVSNAGSISGAGGFGIHLEDGGTVTNASTGRLTATQARPVYISGAAGTVQNSGLIQTTVGTYTAVVLQAGGYVRNASSGTITSAFKKSVYISGANASVFNAGTISAAGASTNAVAVYLKNGGRITNAAGGDIAANLANGIQVNGAAGIVLNAGSVSSQGTTAGAGIALQAGGYISNASGGTISSPFRRAIYVSGAGTVLNAGLITGGVSADVTAIYMKASGVLTNMSTGTISSGEGIGVRIFGIGTVLNAGSVSAVYSGINLLSGGSVSNASTGRITTTLGPNVYVTRAAGVVLNSGTLINYGAHSAVYMKTGGYVSNASSGLLSSAQWRGLSVLNGTGTVMNAGTITASGTEQAVALLAGGYVGNASSGTLSSVDSQAVYIAGAAGTVVNGGAITGGGGTAVALAAGFANRLVDDPGATFSGTVSGGNTVGSTIVSTLELASGASTGTLSGVGTQFIDFGQTTIDASAAWTLQFPSPLSAHGSISGFAASDTLDLAGVAPASVAWSVGMLTFTGGGFPLSLVGAAGVQAISDDSGGALVTVACFREGTRIRTPNGDVAVENLQAGDTVVTLLGVAPVIWVGYRGIDCSRNPEPQNVWPVRIAKDALGDGQPYRELFLSPDHAIFVDDVLIPVKHLINGSSIVQVPIDTVTYYHVELPHHDVLFADGLPTESYLNTGDRQKFANGGGPITLHPDLSTRTWEAEGCAPLVVAGPRLEALRRRLNSIANDHKSLDRSRALGARLP